MAFRVAANAAKDQSRVPDRLRRDPLPDLRPTAPIRELVLFEGKDPHGRLRAMLGTLREGAKTWHDPVTEDPLLGAIEAWDIYNATPDTHPIHVHLVQFEVVDLSSIFGGDPETHEEM